MSYKSDFHLCKLFIVISLILDLSAVFSMGDFRPGYIITLDNDTTFGQINYNVNLYKECEFKQNEDSKVTVYHPNQIKGYRFIDSKYFISKVITLQNSYVKTENTQGVRPDEEDLIRNSSYENEGTTTMSVFIEFLVEGELNLYYYKGVEDDDHYFLETKDLKLVDLTPEEIQRYINGALVGKRTSNFHKGKIKSVMQDCPQIWDKINSVEMNHHDLINLTSQYHNYVCKDHNCTIYRGKVVKPKVGLALHLGGAYSKTSFITVINSTTKYELFKYESGIGPQLGIDILFHRLIPSREKLAFRLGLDYILFNFKNEESYYSIGNTIPRKFNTYAHTFIASISGIYKYSTKKNYFFNEAGIVFKDDYLYDKEVENSDGRLAFVEKRDFNYGGMISMGYSFPIFSSSKQIFTKFSYNHFDYEYFISFIAGIEF